MTPGQPLANPPFLLFDSDVLLQLLVSSRLSLLRWLKSEYGMRPYVVDAVHGEFVDKIEREPKFRARREQGYKALRNGSLEVVTREALVPIFGAATAALMDQAEAEGLRLYSEIGRGEAYSIAAANCYGFPVFTNDGSALSHLVKAEEKLPAHCLRFWDLVVLAHQAGHLEAKDCDLVRQELRRADERTLDCFKSKSFVDGLTEFFPRIMDCTKMRLSCGAPRGRFDQALRVTPTIRCGAPARA